MGEIIKLSDFKGKRRKETDDLTQLLKQATILDQIKTPPPEVIMLCKSDSVAKLFQRLLL